MRATRFVLVLCAESTVWNRPVASPFLGTASCASFLGNQWASGAHFVGWLRSGHFRRVVLYAGARDVRDWRDFEAFKCFVSAAGSAGPRVQVRELRDHERQSCAGFQNSGYVVRLAWNPIERNLGR